MEEFTPQEYIAGCDNSTLITTELSGYNYLFLDLTKDGYYNKTTPGERFGNSGQNVNCGDKRIVKGVNVYKLLQYHSNSNIEWQIADINPNNGVEYLHDTEFTHTYSGNTTRLKFSLLGNYDIKISENHKAYLYNQS